MKYKTEVVHHQLCHVTYIKSEAKINININKSLHENVVSQRLFSYNREVVLN